MRMLSNTADAQTVSQGDRVAITTDTDRTIRGECRNVEIKQESNGEAVTEHRTWTIRADDGNTYEYSVTVSHNVSMSRADVSIDLQTISSTDVPLHRLRDEDDEFRPTLRESDVVGFVTDVEVLNRDGPPVVC